MANSPKGNWSIRSATPEDATALGACMHAAYGAYDSLLSGEILPPMSVDYAAEIRFFPVWVAESDGQVVGGLVLSPENDHMTIANIAVDPQYQGRGLGRGLLEFAEAEALRQGKNELHLATHIKLEGTFALYQHLGWIETGRDHQRVYMQRKLTS